MANPDTPNHPSEPEDSEELTLDELDKIAAGGVRDILLTNNTTNTTGQGTATHF